MKSKHFSAKFIKLKLLVFFKVMYRNKLITKL